MKIVKVGKYTVMRHWFKWYWVHQFGGGSPLEENRVELIDFTEPIE